MSFKRLKTFIAVADANSFADAAEQMYLTPAAVSQQMKALEEELGINLFDRTKRRSPVLNKLGYALVPKARGIIKSYNNLTPSITDDGCYVEELTVGAVGTAIISLVPRILVALKTSYSNLHIRIVPGLSSDLIAQVDRGFLDAAIISKPTHQYRHLQWRPFAEEPLIIIASSQVEQNDPDELLETYPYIRFNRKAWVGQMIDEWLSNKKLRIRETMELDTLESIWTMVHHNLGVSIVPKRCVASPTPFSLKRIELHSPSIQRQLGLVSKIDSTKFKFLDIFYAELVSLVEVSDQVKSIKIDTDVKKI